MRLQIAHKDTINEANEHGLFALKEDPASQQPGVEFQDWYVEDPEFGLVFVSQSRAPYRSRQLSESSYTSESNNTWTTFSLGNGVDVTVRQSNLDLMHWRVYVGAARALVQSWSGDKK